MRNYLLKEFLACAQPFLENETFEQFEQRLELVENPQQQFLSCLKNHPMWFGRAMRSLDKEGNFHVFFHYERLPLKPWEKDKPARLTLELLDYSSKPVIQVISYQKVQQ